MSGTVDIQFSRSCKTKSWQQLYVDLRIVSGFPLELSELVPTPTSQLLYILHTMYLAARSRFSWVEIDLS